VVTAEGIQFSSLYKGESLGDSIRVIGQYADIITMRHPEEGSADRAAAVSPVPFINAGDGPGQHPTQGLLDLFTVQKECGRLENLTVAFVGDMKFGRTARSFSLLLSLYPNLRCVFVTPQALRMPEKTLAILAERGVTWNETDQLTPALDADVIYMTRIQKERFSDPNEYEALKDSYILTAEMVRSKQAKVMHPLPRVNEIATDVDALPNAAYFRQARNGLLVRMALLSLLLDA
jgi:aspartate carbamoyltransferase catalytic subunit